MSLSTGEIIEGKYRIIRLIGEGGMGAVYEGENTRIHRRVAIKVLHQGVAENQEAVQRFEREAQAAGRIGNDHILEVIDMGSLPNGDHFMVMEYLDGEALSERIRRLGRLRADDVAPLAMQALEGLKAAHEAGIVHRDLKPDNIFVLREKAGQKDFVKLIDFGISKFSALTGGSEMKMTRTGTVMGTPYYMSPEQASGSREADHRSDLYAMGVILYEAVTGRVPFDAATFNQLLFQIVLSDPAPPQQVVPELDPAFASIIAKAMARDVEHRFQTAEEFSLAIGAWRNSGASVSVRPASAGGSPFVARPAMGSLPNVELSGVDASRAVKGATTPDVWAQSQLAVQAPVIPKSKSPIIALGVVGFLLVAGMGWGAMQLFSRPSAPTDASKMAATHAPSTVDSVIAAAPDVSAPSVEPVATVAEPAVSSAPEPSVQAPSVVVAPNKPKTNGTAKVQGLLQKPKTPSGGVPVKPEEPPKTKPDATAKDKPTPARTPKPAGGQVDFGY